MIGYYLEQLKSLKYLADFEADLSNGYVISKRYVGHRIDCLGLGSLREGRVYAIGCEIRFTQVENFMLDYETGDMDSTLTGVRHAHITGYELGKGVYEHFPIKLDSREEVDRAVLLSQKFLEQDAKPFFEHWNDMRDLLPYLELDHNDAMAHFKVLGNWIYRKAVIWYLTSHPQYQAFVDFHLDNFDILIKQKVSKADIYKQRFVTLIEQLLEPNPLYEWNSDYLIKKEYQPHH